MSFNPDPVLHRHPHIGAFLYYGYRSGKQIVQVDCKGKVRTIFLTRQLCRLLKEYAEKRKVQSGPIFVTRSGKPMDRSNIWREMKKSEKGRN